MASPAVRAALRLPSQHAKTRSHLMPPLSPYGTTRLSGSDRPLRAAGDDEGPLADISDAKSVLQELRAIVPELPSVPVQPVITATQEEPGMFDFFRKFPWFLKVRRYDNQQQLIADLGERVIDPAEKWRRRRPRPRSR
jgi:hypothetical protein